MGAAGRHTILSTREAKEIKSAGVHVREKTMSDYLNALSLPGNEKIKDNYKILEEVKAENSNTLAVPIGSGDSDPLLAKFNELEVDDSLQELKDDFDLARNYSHKIINLSKEKFSSLNQKQKGSILQSLENIALGYLENVSLNTKIEALEKHSELKSRPVIGNTGNPRLLGVDLAKF
ncbi:MAG: hypothetical protein HRT47_09845 [Candidatus Caenarcaniphilales bacterium]|nr:hypothetical protein [Candidatus Caenarcaniphilales bacterium]